MSHSLPEHGKGLRPPGGDLIGAIALCSIVPASPRPTTTRHVSAGEVL